MAPPKCLKLQNNFMFMEAHRVNPFETTETGHHPGENSPSLFACIHSYNKSNSQCCKHLAIVFPTTASSSVPAITVRYDDVPNKLAQVK